MQKLESQRCLIHPLREAVARCPQCQRFYCRECVTEHESRVICASCLKKLSSPASKRHFPLAALWRSVQFALGIVMLWTAFYFSGRLLMLLPDSFHEGTLWEENNRNEEKP